MPANERSIATSRGVDGRRRFVVSAIVVVTRWPVTANGFERSSQNGAQLRITKVALLASDLDEAESFHGDVQDLPVSRGADTVSVGIGWLP
jgi:hypothetical protein